ncbi:hypothetical protein P3T76_014580 [Phytophthora citrophthora]|uniref:Uncharacterized protein n=1 Tax=Phytophthora citrophthora TaxID=4793 RepID=A0AAD9G1F7_9STRA|nr:hypothetical protein P3T76_014580 [Phytophthora citrophthora]
MVRQQQYLRLDEAISTRSTRSECDADSRLRYMYKHFVDCYPEAVMCAARLQIRHHQHRSDNANSFEYQNETHDVLSSDEIHVLYRLDTRRGEDSPFGVNKRDRSLPTTWLIVQPLSFL